MSDRMTAAKVVAKLRRHANLYATRAQAMASHTTDAARIYGVWCDAYMAAADLIEQHLTPQVLDEPDGDGWHWVEGLGVRLVVRVGRDYETFPARESIKGRRVAKIPPGPFAGGTTK